MDEYKRLQFYTAIESHLQEYGDYLRLLLEKDCEWGIAWMIQEAEAQMQRGNKWLGIQKSD